MNGQRQLQTFTKWKKLV